jgi:hypothetical protein
MKLHTTATIELPDYLTAPEPTGIGDLLHATIDSGLVAGHHLTVLLHLIAALDVFPGGEWYTFVNRARLGAKTKLTKQKLGEVLDDLERLNNRYHSLIDITRDATHLTIALTPHHIWSAARTKQGKLMSFEVNQDKEDEEG